MPLLLIDATLDRETNKWGATVGFPGGCTLVRVGALSSREEALRIALASLAVCADTDEALQALTTTAASNPTSELDGGPSVKHRDLTAFTEYVLSGAIFAQAVCGYWLHSIHRVDTYPDSDEGEMPVVRWSWLVYEAGGDVGPTREAIIDAKNAWSMDKPLPAHVMVLDAGVCERAWDRMVLREGLDWSLNSDSNSFDIAIQLALLGEIRYG